MSESNDVKYVDLVQSGQKVSDFINALNNNFKELDKVIGSDNMLRQIKISDTAPTDTDVGTNGDIWIVYEKED